jgi:hypothetical protein
MGLTVLVRSAEIGLKAYVGTPVPGRKLSTTTGSAGAAPRPGRPNDCAPSLIPAEYRLRHLPEGTALEEGHNMEILIASVGVMVALILILTVMNRRERRTRDLIALDERGILDARRHNDATASQ